MSTQKQLLVSSPSAKLFTTVYPNEGAETVILLHVHGGPGVPMDFSVLVEPLRTGYQVVAFDQRGTGRSPAERATFSIEEYVEDIDAVARHLELSEVHLFGHSWGGLYAQIYAEIRPENVSSLFLCSPGSGTGEHWKETEREVLAFNKTMSGPWGWSMLGVNSLLGMLGSDRACQTMFKKILENYTRPFDPDFRAVDAMVEHVRAKPINRTRSHLIEHPLLRDGVDHRFPIVVAYGEHDVYGDSKRHVRKRYPNATFIEYRDSGHVAWMQNEADVVASLARFYGL